MADHTPATDLQTEEAIQQFVREWGRMSSSWGINRTMAQIHGLLLCTGRPFTVDELMAELHISRGNASMNLRDLMDWGIIRRYREPGDRKDLYVSHGDVWSIFARVVRERKRREIDPTVAAIRECIDLLPEAGAEPVQDVRDRLGALLEVFGIVDRIFNDIFESDQALHAAIQTLREDYAPTETSEEASS